MAERYGALCEKESNPDIAQHNDFFSVSHLETGLEQHKNHRSKTSFQTE